MWRVLWQHNATLLGDVSSEIVPNLEEVLNLKKSLWSDLDHLGAAEPVFKQPASELRAALQNSPSLQGDPAMDFAGYFHIFVSSYNQAMVLVTRLRADASVRYADLQGRLRHPVMFGQTRRAQILDTIAAKPTQNPNLQAEQGYLNPAPEGVDALYAWTIPGGRGIGIRVCDIESGWNFDHEDLMQNDDRLIYGQNDFAKNGDGSDRDSHGTAVLGIFHGDNNNIGVTGIAADTQVSASSANYEGQLHKWNAAGAIKFAADHWLRTGDVMLLEMHAPGPNCKNPENVDSQQGYVAVEWWLPEFSAIKYAVSKGIHVIEAAGNGSENFDASIYNSMFSRAVRDSGAILVGGGNSSHDVHPRSRIWWSNYGRRLDVQGWGYDIVTTGGRQTSNYYDRINDPDTSRCYTQSFGGTSGASPIVVGVVSCICGALRAARKPALSPTDMRRLVVSTGTPQTSAPGFPLSERIGPLPNLKAALQQLGLSPTA